jgi:hypothetical protein
MQAFYTRDQIVEMYRILVAKGYSSPDGMTQDDPDVVEADKAHVAWVEQNEALARASQVPGAIIEHSFSATTVCVDAGFDDPGFLEDTANDFLAEDLAAAEEAGLSELAARIQAKIDEINGRLEALRGK